MSAAAEVTEKVDLSWVDIDSNVACIWTWPKCSVGANWLGIPECCHSPLTLCAQHRAESDALGSPVYCHVCPAEDPSVDWRRL